MSPKPNPLEVLLRPLQFASARDFANLNSVKGLRVTLSAAIERARGEVSPGVVAALSAELEKIDSLDVALRRESVTRVLKIVQGDPVLPAAPRGDVQGEVPTPPPGPAVPKKPAKPLAPGAERAPKKKPKKKDPDESPAKILSIAPAAGPLATLLKNVGFRLNPRLVGMLNKKGMLRTGDVLFLLPRIYEDRRTLKKIAQLQSGERATFIATVRRAEETWGRRRQFRAVLADDTGSIAAVFFQTGPWMKARFPEGKRLVASGEVRATNFGWEIPHPEIEPAEDVDTSPIHFNRIVPVYPGFERHEQRQVRELAYKIADKYAESIDEPLPDALRSKLKLMGLGEALKFLHFPPPTAPIDALDAHTSLAHQRLAFDELFFLQLGMALRRQGVKVQPGIAFDVRDEYLEKAKSLLPFTLTGAQSRVVAQILRDMARAEPMNRLVQGDVGSGKTAVAMIAAAIAVQNGFQVAVMAPTEILAEQHHRSFSRWFAPLGVEVSLITGGGAAREKARQREAVASGRTQIAVGTHALIQDSVAFSKLGLVVIDEQHRFGVIQRHSLMDKGVRPDVVVMTATPIPRTLAMTMYGDLDVSVIDELPPGRTPIETRVFTEKARNRAHELVRAELKKGHQAYVIYPLVEESEKLDLSDATQGAAQLATIFPEARVGLLHGRMKQEEKDAVMAAFRAHELDLLVSTTVIEVGVDVPNASVMVMEHAERFGLSQLHQLRGRVGRGAAKSYCVLLTGYALSEEAHERLAVMEQSTDGFVIAERDLEIRGPGEFLGTRQSGLPELAVANLARDQVLLSQAQEEARAIVAKDPRLEAPEHARLVKALEERWEGRLKLARVG
ncbi:MAG: DNA helicase RecG [Archangium gephyra]|uniref:ATP-dependent DNA helicase RecG n=1 Tax=Archangium gephyra TaxID=48 RepID=A0A2W5TRJ3_9BACT|nr:MAG: DNA helicase RecG [Archangium gephyra]